MGSKWQSCHFGCFWLQVPEDESKNGFNSKENEYRVKLRHNIGTFQSKFSISKTSPRIWVLFIFLLCHPHCVGCPWSYLLRGARWPQGAKASNPHTTSLEKNYWLFILFFFSFKLIYLFLAVLGLRFCARAFSSWGRRGPLFIAMRGPLTIAASLVAGHRLQTRRLSRCGSRAQLLRGMWDPPRPGPEPASPALAGRLSTAAPPGKPYPLFQSKENLFQKHSKQSTPPPTHTHFVGHNYVIHPLLQQYLAWWLT